MVTPQMNAPSTEIKRHPMDVQLEAMDNLLNENIPAWIANGPVTYRQRAWRWLRLWSQTRESIQKEVDAYHARNRFSQFFYWLFNVNDIAWKVQWQAHQDVVNQMKKDKEAFKENKESFLKNKNFMTPYENFLNQSSVPSVWRRGWNGVLSSVMTWWKTLFQPQQPKQKIMARRLSEPTPGESKSMFRVPYVTSRLRAASIGVRKEKNALTEDQQKDFYYICGFFGLTPERVTLNDLKEACRVLLESVAKVSQHDIKIRLQKAALLFSVLPKQDFSHALFSTLAKTKQATAIKQANADRKPATTPRMLTFEQPKKEEEKKQEKMSQPTTPMKMLTLEGFEKEEKIPEAPLIQLNDSESIQVAKILGLFFKTANEIEAEGKGEITPATAEFKWNINDEIPSDVFKERRKALCLIVHPDKKREHIIPTLTLNTVDNAYKNFQTLCGGNKRIRLVQNNEAVVNAYDEARKKTDPTYITKAEAEMNEFKKQAAKKDERAKKEIARLEKKLEEEQEITKQKEAEMTERSREAIQNGIHLLKKEIDFEKRFFPKEIIESMLEKITQIENIIFTASQRELLNVVSSQLSGVVHQLQEEKQKISASQHMASDTKSTATEAPTPTPSPAPVTIASPSHIHGLFDAMASVPATTPPVLKEEKQNHPESNETTTQVLH